MMTTLDSTQVLVESAEREPFAGKIDGAASTGAARAEALAVLAGDAGHARDGAAESVELPLSKASALLRGILLKNPGIKTFSVQRILSSVGSDRFEALLVLSLPAIVPVTGGRRMAAMSAGAIGCQMAAGSRRIKLPSFILKKSVSRRALAVAIHAVLPILEAAQKMLRPRWSWVSHANVRRAVGLFVFLLAIAIAQPFFGFHTLHATSIFVMSLGMAENDGLAVLLGVAVGLVSLATVVASGLSVRARAGAWLRKLARRLGLTALAAVLKRHGYDRVAEVVTLQWSDLLLLWNPGRPAVRHGRPMSA
jgi:hypothetical protein